MFVGNNRSLITELAALRFYCFCFAGKQADKIDCYIYWY